MSGFILHKDQIKDSEYVSSEYPFESKFLNLSAGKIHYIDEGKGFPIVFVHGTPSWSFEWRKQISTLRSSWRCLALDHLGFGLSERPESFEYSFEAHCKNFEEWIQKLGLKEFILVVHDVGGPIALPYAAQNPHQIKKLIILNSWFWPFEQYDPKFEKQKKMVSSGLMKWLYLKWNFSPKMMIRMSWGKSSPLPKKLHRLYQNMFPNLESRKSTWKLVGEIVGSKPYFESYMQKLQTSLRNIPVLILWGTADQLIPALHLQGWKEKTPHSSIEEIPQVGHFPQEEASELVTEKILSFLRN